MNGWHQLELRRDPSGWRHYLGGEPVQCGTLLELQALDWRDGEWTPVADEGVPVRYEAALWATAEPTPVLIGALGGRVVTLPFDAESMRFRWPGVAEGRLVRHGAGRYELQRGLRAGGGR